MSVYIARSSAVVARSFDGEMIVMSTLDSTVFSLSEVASEIWRSADGRTPLDQIFRDRICSQFDVDPTSAYTDAEVFCRELAGHGVLLLLDQPVEP